MTLKKVVLHHRLNIYLKNLNFFIFLSIFLRSSLNLIKSYDNIMDGYCVKCRSKRTMKNSKSVIMKNGRPAQKGICDTCDTIMFKIGKY